MQKQHVTVIGTGAYGTAIANVLADNGHTVVMYGIVESQVDAINLHHKSEVLQGVSLHPDIKATIDLPAALESTEVLVLSVPSVALDQALTDIKKYAKHPMIIINTVKGLDAHNLGLLSAHIQNKFADTGLVTGYAGLYGPSFAVEVASREQTCVMVASADATMAHRLATDVLSNEYFHAYPTTDLAGCEVAAALKNAVAIAAGIFDGRVGKNGQAALLTTGLNEIFQLAQPLGARPDSMMSFAGLGDLVLTATSTKSRNYSLGVKMAELNDAAQALAATTATVEGVESVRVGYALVKKFGINSRLFTTLYEILYNGTRPLALLNNVF